MRFGAGQRAFLARVFRGVVRGMFRGVFRGVVGGVFRLVIRGVFRGCSLVVSSGFPSVLR